MELVVPISESGFKQIETGCLGRRQPGIPLPEPELIIYVCPTPRFPLKFVINAGSGGGTSRLDRYVPLPFEKENSKNSSS